ncbi:MAG: Ig-like domain-containing protein [Halothiobacillaceae bacterium]
MRYNAGNLAGTDSLIATTTDAAGKEASASAAITVKASVTVVGSVNILSSNSAIGTNNATPLDVIVQVKSASNVLMAGIPVTLTADKGTLDVINSVTDSSGSIVAKLSTGGLYDNTQITLNASAGGINATPLVVNVTGTTIVLSGPSAAAIGAPVPYNLLLKDSKDKPIVGKLVTLTSDVGSLDPTSVITDNAGLASFKLTTSLSATLTATSLGATATTKLTVANTSVDITVDTNPGTDSFVDINTSRNVTALVKNYVGDPVAGVNVTFTSTRGTPTPQSAITDGNGLATVSISSPTSGPHCH